MRAFFTLAAIVLATTATACSEGHACDNVAMDPTYRCFAIRLTDFFFSGGDITYDKKIDAVDVDVDFALLGGGFVNRFAEGTRHPASLPVDVPVVVSYPSNVLTTMLTVVTSHNNVITGAISFRPEVEETSGNVSLSVPLIPKGYAQLAFCTDGVQDQADEFAESDVDCGNRTVDEDASEAATFVIYFDNRCPRCVAGKSCRTNADCRSMKCTGKVCE